MLQFKMHKPRLKRLIRPQPSCTIVVRKTNSQSWDAAVGRWLRPLMVP